MSQAPAISPPGARPGKDPPAAQFRILGSLAASIAGEPIPLGGPKQRLILALLILEANRIVSADRLIAQVWGDEPPDAARGTLQAYISRLRRALGVTRIEAQAPGYVLRAERDEVDGDQFERQVAEARRRLDSDPQAAKTMLDAALGLWRGPALDDLSTEPSVHAHVSRLEELRVSALGLSVEAGMALGHHAELLGELERLVAQHPLHELKTKADPFRAQCLDGVEHVLRSLHQSVCRRMENERTIR